MGRRLTQSSSLQGACLRYGSAAIAFDLGTPPAQRNSVRMDKPDYRELEEMCRKQAALTTHEATKHELERMAEEYRLKAEHAARSK